MTVSDELVRTATLAFLRVAFGPDHEDSLSNWHAEVRAAILAILPAIQAEERERCAKVCDFMADETRKQIAKLPGSHRQAGKSLRAMMEVQAQAAENRAAAIRAMGEKP